MIKNLFKNYIYPISVFSGGMIGVGFLSLPYVAMKSGIWVMMTYFVVLTALMATINLIFAEISLKTPDFKRFPGFVGKYLGKYAKAYSLISVVFSGISILLVYLIVGGQFLFSALSPVFYGNILAYTLIYFAVASAIIYFDIKVIKKFEFWILSLLFVSLIVVSIEGFSQIKISHIFFNNSPSIFTNIFLPYGPIIFSLWGIGLIPETEEMLRGDKKTFKKVITISTVIVAVFYFLFTILILSISGTNTTESALTGLSIFVGRGASLFALLIGVLATFTAFISQGIILKKVLMYDLKINHWQAFIMTCCTPLVFFLLGFNSFVLIISLVGGVLLSIDVILILLMFKKVKKYKL
jgi:amino acid permease